MSQLDLNNCARKNYERSDRALNKVYSDLMLDLSPADQKKLEREQQAWAKQLEPRCHSDNKANVGGSIYPMLVLSCMDQQIKFRLEEIKQWKANRGS